MATLQTTTPSNRPTIDLDRNSTDNYLDKREAATNKQHDTSARAAEREEEQVSVVRWSQ